MSTYIEGMMPEQFLTKVVGVSFSENYPNNIYALAKDVALMTAPCQLVREPDNEYDEHAIRVDVNGSTIGHIPRLIALILAPKMDKGETWVASVHSIVVSNENVNQPGLKINVWRKENADV